MAKKNKAKEKDVVVEDPKDVKVEEEQTVENQEAHAEHGAGENGAIKNWTNNFFTPLSMIILSLITACSAKKFQKRWTRNKLASKWDSAIRSPV